MTAALHVRRVEIDADPGGWGRWEVVDDAGQVIGLVTERREWSGHDHGPAAYDVACRPDPMPAPACWSSQDHGTVTAALDALTRHRRYVDHDPAGIDVHRMPDAHDDEGDDRG